LHWQPALKAVYWRAAACWLWHAAVRL